MNAAGLMAVWDRISDAPDAVGRLRRFVLDLAVRGKLVEQDRQPRPMSDTRLIGVEKLLDREEWPFPIPPTWSWARIGELFIYDAGTKREPSELSQDRWLLDLDDVEKDTGRLLRRATVSDRLPSSTKSEFQVGDILYGKLRPYLNKVLVDEI